MTRLPDHLVVIMTEGDWNVSAYPADHPNLAAEVVSEAERRKAPEDARPVHVYRVPLNGATEIDAVPSHQVPASLQERTP